MTLPWDEPMEQPQAFTAHPPSSAATGDNTADPTQADEPNFNNADHLPDTQVTDAPQEDAANIAPTLAMEPTQIAEAPGAPCSPLTATRLASAAAEAMTGAQATQALGLPASAGFGTSMPSLALPTNPTVPSQAAAPAAAAASNPTGQNPRPMLKDVTVFTCACDSAGHAKHEHCCGCTVFHRWQCIGL